MAIFYSKERAFTTTVTPLAVTTGSQSRGDTIGQAVLAIRRQLFLQDRLGHPSGWFSWKIPSRN